MCDFADSDAARQLLVGRVLTVERVVSEAISHPSPRLVDAIEQLARVLHPERFLAATAEAGGK